MYLVQLRTEVELATEINNTPVDLFVASRNNFFTSNCVITSKDDRDGYSYLYPISVDDLETIIGFIVDVKKKYISDVKNYVVLNSDNALCALSTIFS